MTVSPYIVIELTLLESRGPFFAVGEPTMLCRFKAVHAPGTQLDEGKVCVVARDKATNAWREYARPAPMEQSQEIMALLASLGVPDRAPDAEGVFDTSDGWTDLLIHVRTERRAMSFNINMHSSGFDGQDAETLRALFRRLFALAGYEDFSQVVYGSRLTF